MNRRIVRFVTVEFTVLLCDLQMLNFCESIVLKIKGMKKSDNYMNEIQ